MEKKAYLVYFSPCVRVFANSDEEAVDLAVAEIKDNPSIVLDMLYENIEDVIEDE